LIRDYRHDVVGKVECLTGRLENRPGVIAGFQVFERACEGKFPGQHFGTNPEQAWFLGEIEVEAVGLIAVAQTERHKAHAFDDFLVEVVEISTLCSVVHVVHDGDAGFAHKFETTGSGAGIVGVNVGIFLEYTDGGDHETAASQHADCGHAASAPTRGVPLAKAGKRQSIPLAKRIDPGQVGQSRGGEGQAGEQQQSACGVEGIGGHLRTACDCRTNGGKRAEK